MQLRYFRKASCVTFKIRGENVHLIKEQIVLTGRNLINRHIESTTAYSERPRLSNFGAGPTGLGTIRAKRSNEVSGVLFVSGIQRTRWLSRTQLTDTDFPST